MTALPALVAMAFAVSLALSAGLMLRLAGFAADDGAEQDVRLFTDIADIGIAAALALAWTAGRLAS